jgi:hypothetical protein
VNLESVFEGNSEGQTMFLASKRTLLNLQQVRLPCDIIDLSSASHRSLATGD